MPVPYLLKPDTEFLGRILDEGGEDLKKCFQCGTCSVVCDLAKGRKPFPRKEMIWAQWGLKDRLVADPDIWLCHQCNDCSARCPRGARPGDVLATLRRESVFYLAVPRFLSHWTNHFKYIPLLLLIPAALLGLALALRQPLAEALSFGEHHGFFAGFFPHWLLIGFFSFFAGLAFLSAVAGAVRFWRAMKALDVSTGHDAPALGIVPSMIRTLKSISIHDKFGQCTTQASRRTAHLAAFYGFVALFVVTVWAVIDLYVMPYLFGIDSLYPFGLFHPMKILANIGCVALIFGCLKAIADRMGDKQGSSANTSFDWIFLGLLLSVAVTGLLTEILRFGVEPAAHAAEQSEHTGLEYVAFGVYFVHLVLVFDLLICLPFSKFAHVLYRPVALVYAEYSGRNVEKVRSTGEVREAENASHAEDA
jgi:quinone-modifying oxidoreductase subunit QmoC